MRLHDGPLHGRGSQPELFLGLTLLVTHQNVNYDTGILKSVQTVPSFPFRYGEISIINTTLGCLEFCFKLKEHFIVAYILQMV